MNDALNVLRVNLKNFNWNANVHYKIDKNEAKGILEGLDKEYEKQKFAKEYLEQIEKENQNGRNQNGRS